MNIVSARNLWVQYLLNMLVIAGVMVPVIFLVHGNGIAVGAELFLLAGNLVGTQIRLAYRRRELPDGE